MKANVNRSIEFAKMGSNIALVPKFDTIELSESLTGPLQVVRITHPDMSITLAPLPLDLCARIITDKIWLIENTLCLLSNAVNYSDGGPICIGVSLHSPLPDGSNSSLPMVRVTVNDSGIGISPEARSKLFQPFQQAQRMAGGSGLGLFSLSKRIAALGGRCGVDSRADGARGSSFWFEFPYRPYAIEFADDANTNDSAALVDASNSSGNKNDIVRVTLNEVDVDLSASEAHPWAMRRRSMLRESPSREPTITTSTRPLRILLGTFTPRIIDPNS
jgi:hypothetical protein